MAKIIKETYKKENGELVKYPLGADIKNVVITKVDENGNEVIKSTLDKELEIIKQDSSSAAYPSYSIENIEEEGLEKLTKGESISASIRKLYKVTSRFINHLKNVTSGENHIPTGGKKGDILLWSSDGQAKWGPDENTTYSNFQGATANDSGKAGLVLAPAAGEQNKFLKGDGTWGSPDNAQYTPGIGISILNNQIGLATATITNTKGTDTLGTEIILPHLVFDEYGRVKNIGTKKHTLPNSTFVGGTLTETLYYGSDKKYSTSTSGISTLSKIMLKIDSGYTGIDLISGTNNYNIGIDENILQFKKDDTIAYQIDSNGNNIFNTDVSVTGLKSTDKADRVIIADGTTGKLKINSAITATELNYLDGVTSNIQTQLGKKVDKSAFSNASLGQGYGTCTTAAATTAKVVTLSNYTLTVGGIVSVKFTYAVPASATMNINGKGAKNIFYRGSAIVAGIIKAGDIVTFIYDGKQYHLISIDKGILNNTAKGDLGFVTSTAENLIPTISTIAFWDGAYSGTSSNLAYCAKGAFGSIVTKNTDDYLPISGGTLSGSLTAPTFNGSLSGNASAATKLATGRTIDGVSFNGSANIIHYGKCSTAAATAAKTVTCTGFTLDTGATIKVKFTVTNTASSPTLNVNSTGAKSLMYRGSAITAGYLAANRVYEFVYDGTNYELVGDINTDANTDTKNTAGSTNSSSKLFLIGATSQAANPQTYSHDTAYVGTDGCLYSNSKKVSVDGHTHSYLPLSGGTLTGSVNISTSDWNTLNLHRKGGSGNASIRFSNENSSGNSQILGYLAMSKVDGSFYRYAGTDPENNFYTMVDSGNYSSIINTTKSNVTKPTSGTTYLLPFHANLSETGNTIIRCNNGIGCTLLEGTTSANGYSVLNLGNEISSGTSGNKYGVLKLFGTGANYVQLKANGAPTANRTISFPDINGTVPIVASASHKGSASITLEANSFYLVSVGYGGNMYYNGYASTGTQGATLTEINRQGGGNESHIDGYKITFTSSNSSYTVTVKYIKIR